MQPVEIDFLGRLRGLLELGPAVFFSVIFLALLITVITVWRGVGPALFFLVLSYAFSAVMEGGVVFLSTVVRWGCLLLCMVGFFKRSSRPKTSMFLFLFYAFLGLLSVARSDILMMSLQRAVLLMLVVLCVPAAIHSYITSPDKIASLFKMGIISAASWVGVSLIFFRDFMHSGAVRFQEDVTVGFAWAGAFFSPMLLWGIMQKRELFWRILCLTLLVPFCFLLFIGGVRTAIFGMLIIASLPMLFSKFNPIKIIVTLVAIVILISFGKYLLFALLPGAARSLTEKVISADTSGRVELWTEALHRCLTHSMLFGKGIGSSGTMAVKMGHGFHNAYLIIWYNAGFVSVLAVLLFLFIYTMRCGLQILKHRKTEMGDYSRIALGYMLGIIAIGFFESSFATSSGVAAFMLMVVTALIDRIAQMGDEYSYDTLDQKDELLTDSSYYAEESDFEDAYVFY